MNGFSTNEKETSQITALQELINLGYIYLTPSEALQERGGRAENVLLGNILCTKLKEMNRIFWKEKTHHFSQANIEEAVQKLRNAGDDVSYRGLRRTNETVYDLLTLGADVQQKVEGDLKTFSLKYIDWDIPSNNIFHITPEFSVQKSRSTDEESRLDIVLFVNGIPFVVFECKAPNIDVADAISQIISYQNSDDIPMLFAYTQLVIATNKNKVRYATAGTAAEHWSVWREKEDAEDEIARCINGVLSEKQKDKLFSGSFVDARKHFDRLERAGERSITEQDRVIYSLCRPERLLDLIYRFIVFDEGVKKIARYQQYFVVRSTLNRVKQQDSEGKRKGGVIWHSQGSGKSLTMVMLTRALVLDKEIVNPRVLLVSDRTDLNKQLTNTFNACQLSNERATSGRDLVKHIKNEVGIITTLVHKFDKGWGIGQFVDHSSDIFALIDESHRTQHGMLGIRMKQMLPNSCYIGFTGTPLLKKQKSTFLQFGDLIEPHYSMKQAVEDKAVLPLLYESRYVVIKQDQTIDLWFERHTAGLNKQQKTDLKRKYAKADQLNRAEQVVYRRAFDISQHYRQRWQGMGFKAQLVAPDRATALKYHNALEEIGNVSSEVIISAPDMRQGYAEVDEQPTAEVNQFWERMMRRFGSEDEYLNRIIDQFKNSDTPEIIIVVDKLLTGFDAPRNTVLYLCKKLKEHALLQAIARVNRLYKGKDFGYIIDYMGMLEELDKALTMYEAFEGFDEADIEDTLISIEEEVRKLPQAHSNLHAVFSDVKNKHDGEAFERLLADEGKRLAFYGCLSAYGRSLDTALSTYKFVINTDEETLQKYKSDLTRFQKLKQAVQLRYGETVDYGKSEAKIKKLLDTHIEAHEVRQLQEPTNIFGIQPFDIFDEQQFNDAKDGEGQYTGKSLAARADTIAYGTERIIREMMDTDPALYQKFSQMIQQVIDAFRAGRLSELAYLTAVCDMRDQVVSPQHSDVPDNIKGVRDGDAEAVYGVVKPYFAGHNLDETQIEGAASQTALAILDIVERNKKVDFWKDDEAQNRVKVAIDDFFYETIKKQFEVGDLVEHTWDEMVEGVLQVAKNRRIVQ